MAVPEQIPVVNYVADGVVKKFDVPFEYDQQSDLHLYVDGIEPTIDKYFFADNAFNFYIAPTIGQDVKIKRTTPKERDTDYDLHTNTVRPKALNTDFDRLWYVLQEVFSDVGGLSQAVQDEIIARIQGDEDLLNQLTAEISARMLGDEAVTEDLKNYVDQVIGAIINDPDFDGIDAKNVNDASGETQQQVNYNGGSKWHSRVGGYQENERVVLTNGDIVKSTIDGNANDPNVDMTGWNPEQNIKTFSSIYDLLVSKPDTISFISSYHAGLGLGGGDFLPVQSSLLVENGVTIFKSLVVGYEDYFWVRANTNYITPEMAGAKGDKINNDRLAWQNCLNVGGKIVARDAAQYLIVGDHINTHVGTSVLTCEKPCTIQSQNKSSLYFKHNVTTGSPIAWTIKGTDSNLDGFELSGFNIFGHPDRGHSDKVARCWGVTFRGVDNLTIKNCKFSTNQGRPFTVNRREDGDWIQSTDLNNANTKSAVMRLLDLSSKNVTIENIHQEYFASAGFAIFGGDGVFVDGVTSDTSDATFKYLAWTDDGSSQTNLAKYSLNNNIHFKNVNGDGEVLLDSTANGSISQCNVTKIGYRSYDFDQQKNNFDSGTHIYNPDDHLNEPFLWMKHFKRHIAIHDNTCESISIRGLYADIYENFIHTSANGQSLILFTNNGIAWGTGSSYFDEDESTAISVRNIAKNNSFIVKHSNCIGVDYGSVSPTSRITSIDNSVELVRDGLNFTPLRPFNPNYRRESHLLTSTNDGRTLSKMVNHHVDVRQGQLTQGVGFNHLKTFANLYASQANQPIASFTNSTTAVEFLIQLFDSSGSLYKKRVSVSAANVATVTDLSEPAQTSYNASFTVSVANGVTTLNFSSSTRDITLDITGIGVNGNCKFITTLPRSIASGG